MESREIADALALVEQFKRMRITTVNGDFPLVWTKNVRDCYLDLRALSGTGVPVTQQSLPVGTAGYVLVSDSGEAAGVRWANVGTDLSTWVEGVQAAGGTFGTYSIARAARLLVQLHAASYYSKIVYFLPLLGGDLTAARMPLIDTLGTGIAGTAGFVEADFSEATGLQGDGTSKYLQTNILPSAIGTGSNGGLGYWENNVAFTGTSVAPIGAYPRVGPSYYEYNLQLRSASRRFGWGATANVATTGTGAGVNAHYYGQRSASTSRELFQDGVSIATDTSSDSATGIGLITLRVMGAYDPGDGGAPNGYFWGGRCACAYLTDGTLTSGEVAELHTLLDTYLITPTGR